jgi:hypothetical protein
MGGRSTSYAISRIRQMLADAGIQAVIEANADLYFSPAQK